MRILITGAGGAAAVSVWKSLGAEHELQMADMDPLAAGLYLVPPDRRLIIPRGDTPELVPALYKACKERRIEALLPTVDAELAPVAAAHDSLPASWAITFGANTRVRILRYIRRHPSNTCERAVHSDGSHLGPGASE
jgi:hypothetical protein